MNKKNTSALCGNKTLFKTQINASVVSTNKYNRLHWSKKHKLAKDYGWLVAIAIVQGNIQPVTVPAKIKFTLLKPNKAGVRDHMNLSAVEKIITDWFVKKRVFKDDSPDYIASTELEIKIDPEIKEQVIIYEALEA
ncbi:MAG: hypothetical protein C0602_00040 [Denitrovibrio sp.]|nr:MAG: hypothetical protein C0602_00040 [Denitrovibrio sp.]